MTTDGFTSRRAVQEVGRKRRENFDADQREELCQDVEGLCRLDELQTSANGSGDFLLLQDT